ncbi:Polyprenol reductase 1 [Ananas comosus]|uniref:Polyprenol reductase 1 n=1 Tax=Ananas comosus TaxID=4615 RepID=A0A199VZT4_ANACO|nr:Polyprenol reductase 1 [Ananas comosus]
MEIHGLSVELGLVPLLRLAWVAATLPILVASLPLPLTGFAHRIVARIGGRGKIVKPSASKFTVPQRFFLHFYVVGVVLTTLVLLLIWFYAYKEMTPVFPDLLHYSTITSQLTGGSHVFSIHKGPSHTVEHKHHVWQTVFVLLLMEIQLLRRLYETINVFHYGPSAQMHIFGYLAGLFFYIAAPLSLGSSCLLEALNYARGQIAEFIVKGRARMPDIEVDWLGLLKPLLNLGWCQWVGAAIFSWGWLHQLHCHMILGSLRENKGADEYVIPHGDWFRYVSCPHYLAEIVVYAGILVASGGFDITVWLLFSFVVANLVFAAAETHRWYHQKFDDYPQSRRAIIPFVY